MKDEPYRPKILPDGAMAFLKAEYKGSFNFCGLAVAVLI